MPFHRFSALLLALLLCLLPGCGERPISSRLVLSSMGVECSARPLTAVLEVIREEENETITVQGESFTALFSAAERQTGEQVYLGALQSIVFSGVPDGSTLRGYLRALLADGRLSPNTQIALCGDALSLYDGEALTGDSITALLTRQYTDSRRNGLKEPAEPAGGDRPGWSDPLADDGRGRACGKRVPSPPGKATTPPPRSRRRSALCCWASARKCAMRFRLERGGEHPAAAADPFWGQMGG